MSFYSGIRTVFGPIVKCLLRLRVHGVENIPEKGGLMICSNHISAADVIFLTVAVPKRQIRYMAKAEAFKVPILKQFMTAMGAFPIKRGAGDVGAIKKAIAMLRSGETVGIFPQGTRFSGVHPKDSTVKPGAGMIAFRAQTDVLPVAIVTKNYKFKFFRPIHVVIGKPIPYGQLGFDSGNHCEQVAATDKIFEEILKLHEEGIPKK